MSKVKQKQMVLILFVVMLAASLFMLLGRAEKEPLYLDDIPKGYQIQDQISFIRYMLPEEISENVISLNSMAVDAETLKETISSAYVCRDENYGTMMVGPDLMILAARDKQLISMDLSKVSHGEEIRFILKNEVQIDGSVRVKESVKKVIDDAGVVKVIAPVSLKELTFSSVNLEGSYSGYVSMIQSKDSISGVFLAVYPNTLKRADREKQDKVCRAMAKSFQANTSYADYSTYGNVIPEFSYDTGGLFTYEGYAYKTLGTDRLDAHGTYNQIDSMVGMYCLNTSFGPINMPYILNDPNLESSVLDDEELDAQIHSESNTLKYDIHTKSIRENQTFDSIMDELRGNIQNDYNYFVDTCHFNKKSVLSEQVDQGKGAVITVCGWDETTGQMTVVYYKLDVTNDLYTITRIENSQKVTDVADPLLHRIVELSGIVIIVV